MKKLFALMIIVLAPQGLYAEYLHENQFFNLTMTKYNKVLELIKRTDVADKDLIYIKKKFEEKREGLNQFFVTVEVAESLDKADKALEDSINKVKEAKYLKDDQAKEFALGLVYNAYHIWLATQNWGKNISFYNRSNNTSTTVKADANFIARMMANLPRYTQFVDNYIQKAGLWLASYALYRNKALDYAKEADEEYARVEAQIRADNPEAFN